MAQIGELWQPIPRSKKGNPGSTEYLHDIGFRGKTQRRRFIQHAEALQSQLAKEGKPFDFKGAKKDFEALQKKNFLRQRHKVDTVDDVEVELNLAPYSNPKRFKKLRNRRVKENITVDGMKTTVFHTYVDYVCLKNGANYSLHVERENVNQKQDPAESDKDNKK